MRATSSGAADTDLIARAQRGDRAAIDLLFRQLDPDLRRYLVPAAREEADDLVGDVWLGVARSFKRFEGDMAAFRAWIFTIAQRRLIDHRRRRSFRQTDLADLRDLPAAGDVGADDEVVAYLSGRDAAHAVRKLLPPGQADVVLLRVVGQFDVTEVATIMGRSDNWVRVTQHRGLRRLAQQLQSREEAAL